MGHNGHVINLYGVVMILMGNVHAGGQSNLRHLSLLVHRHLSTCSRSLLFAAEPLGTFRGSVKINNESFIAVDGIQYYINMDIFMYIPCIEMAGKYRRPICKLPK